MLFADPLNVAIPLITAFTEPKFVTVPKPVTLECVTATPTALKYPPLVNVNVPDKVGEVTSSYVVPFP